MLRIVTLLLALCLTLPALAGPFEDGRAAYQRGDYATALRFFRPLAEQGDARAQTALGLMYGSGEGVPQDYAQAAAWYRKSAEQGDADAQFILGVMFYGGHGVAQDYGQAVTWYRKSAEQGNADGQAALGLMYGIGEGVPQDYVQAHMWSNLAASRETDPERRSKIAKGRDLLAARMMREQIAEAQRLAREWKPKGQ